MTGIDLAAHVADWVEPIRMGYRGYEVAEIPPNGPGIAALMALGMLEDFDLRRSARITPTIGIFRLKR